MEHPGLQSKGGDPGTEGFGRCGPGSFENRLGGPGCFGGGEVMAKGRFPSHVLEDVIGFTEAQFEELGIIHEELRQNVESLAEHKQPSPRTLRPRLKWRPPRRRLLGT